MLFNLFLYIFYVCCRNDLASCIFNNILNFSIAYNPWSGTDSIPGIQTASLQAIPGN